MPEFQKHVIDTNVLLVASAADDGSPFQPEATPVEEAAYRKQVLDWLIEFEQSSRCLVLDWGWEIVSEYKGVNRRTKLTEQDYGLLVVLGKWDRGEYEGVEIQWDEHNEAILPDKLYRTVTDGADRKMVAAVIAAGGRQAGVNLVNACDTDWYDCETTLQAHDVEVHQLLPNWCTAKWQAKKQR